MHRYAYIVTDQEIDHRQERVVPKLGVSRDYTKLHKKCKKCKKCTRVVQRRTDSTLLSSSE